MTKDILEPYLNKKIKLGIEGRKNCLLGIFEKFDTNLDMAMGETDAIVLKQNKKTLLIPISLIKSII